MQNRHYFGLRRARVARCLLTAFFVSAAVLPSTVEAQVGIGTTVPNASAILDLVSNERGFLPPRLGTADRAAIGSPAEGLMIYNLDSSALEWWDGSNWRTIYSNLGAGGSLWQQLSNDTIFYNLGPVAVGFGGSPSAEMHVISQGTQGAAVIAQNQIGSATGASYGLYALNESGGSGMKYGVFGDAHDNNTNPDIAAFGGVVLHDFAGAAYGLNLNFNGSSASDRYGLFIENETQNYFSNNLGIGELVPGGRLHIVDGDWNNSLIIENLDPTIIGPGVYLRGENGDWALTNSNSGSGHGAGDLTLYDNNTGRHRFLIDPAGNTGIDTVFPNAKLHVAGDFRIAEGTSVDTIWDAASAVLAEFGGRNRTLLTADAIQAAINNATAAATVLTDASLVGDGSLLTPLSLAATGVTSGTYGDPASGTVVSFDVDAQGRLVNASQAPLALSVLPTDFAGDGFSTPLGLAATGVASGTYGDPASGTVVSFDVDAQGRLVNASQAPLALSVLPTDFAGDGFSTPLGLAATGVASGTYGDPASGTVVSFDVDAQGRLVNAFQAPLALNVLPSDFTGDGFSTPLELAPTGVTSGTYGDPATGTVVSFDVDAQGRLVNAFQAPLALNVLPSDFTGDGFSTPLELAPTGVAVGTYGSSTDIPVFDVDANGRIVVAGTQPVVASATGPASGDLTGSYPNPTISSLIGNPLVFFGLADGDVLTYQSGEWLNLPPVPGPWNTNPDGIDYTAANVGIGTSTPVERLNVNGNLLLSGNRALQFNNSDTRMEFDGDELEFFVQGTEYLRFSTLSNNIRMNVDGASDAFIIEDGIAPVFSVSSNGPNPGNVDFSGDLRPNGDAGTPGWLLTSAGANNSPTWTDPSTLGGGSLWTDASPNIYFNTGNVGIGTATPTNGRLEVDLGGSAANASTIYATNSSTGAGTFAIQGQKTGSGSGAAIYGFTTSSNLGVSGVLGAASNGGTGVYGLNTSSVNNSRAIFAESSVSTSNTTYGLHATNGSTNFTTSAAVFGEATRSAKALYGQQAGSGTDRGNALFAESINSHTVGTTTARILNATTTTTNGINKTGLLVQTTGAWSGTGSRSIGLDVSVAGATENIAALFNGGNVGIGTGAGTFPAQALEVNGNVLISGSAVAPRSLLFDANNRMEFDPNVDAIELLVAGQRALSINAASDAITFNEDNALDFFTVFDDAGGAAFEVILNGPSAGNVEFDGHLAPDNLPGTPGHVLSSNGANASPTWVDVNTLVTASGGTLDDAYDFGGPGGGRVINATDGAVEITTGDLFLNGGNLGIGNASPTRPLQVEGALGSELAYFDNNASTGSSHALRADAVEGIAALLNRFGAGTISPVIFANNDAASSSAPVAVFDQGGVGDFFQFQRDGVRQATIDNSGNLGIGIAPLSPLHVSTPADVSVRVRNTLATGVTEQTGIFTLISNTSGGTQYGLNTTLNGNASGAAKYAYAAEFSGNATAVGNNHLFYGQYTTNTSGADYGIYLENEAASYFSGNVGIGVTNANLKLDVAGGATRVSHATTNTAEPTFLALNQAGSQNFGSAGGAVNAGVFFASSDVDERKTALVANARGTDGDKYGINTSASGGGTNNRNYGVFANANGASSLNYGILAEASGGATAYGGFFRAQNAGTQTNFGIYARAAGSTTDNIAGFFDGNVDITQELRANGDEGTAGFLLTSGGAGAPLSWTDPSTLGGSSPWTVSGSEIYYDVAGGNVGIGTNVTAATLSVVGDQLVEYNGAFSAIQTTLTGSASGIFVDNNGTNGQGVVVDQGTSTGIGLQVNSTSTGVNPLARITQGSISAAGPALRLEQNGTGDLLQLREDGTSVAVFRNNGNLGIGTGTPNYALEIFRPATDYLARFQNNEVGSSFAGGIDVQINDGNLAGNFVRSGNLGTAGVLRVENNGATSGGYALELVQNTTNTGAFLAMYKGPATTPANIVSIFDENGNLGIGTDNPNNPLVIDRDDANTAAAIFNSSALATQTGLNVDVSNGTGAQRVYQGYLVGNGGSNDKYFIDGYMEISPASTGDHYGFWLDYATPTSGNDYGVWVRGEEYNYFEGNVGIGVTERADVKLLVDGTYAANNTPETLLRLVRRANGPFGDDGIGAAIDFDLENNAGATEAAGQLLVEYLNLATPDREATFKVNLKTDAGTLGQQMSLSQSTLLLGSNGLNDGTLRLYAEQGITDYALNFRPNNAMTQSYFLTFPPDDGAPNQFLQTDGAGNLSWANGGGGSLWTDASPNIYYNTGNVGIGDLTPDAPLDIEGNATGYLARINNTSATAFSGAGLSVTINDGNQAGYFSRAGATGSGGVVLIEDLSATSGGEVLQLGVQPGHSGEFLAMYNGSVSTPANIVATFDANGNLGIGTNNPNSPLLVVRNDATTTAQIVNDSPLGFQTGMSVELDNGTGRQIVYDGYLIGNAGTDEKTMFDGYMELPAASSGDHYGYRLRYDQPTAGLDFGVHIEGEAFNYFSGNVGIGVNTPNSPLVVTGNVVGELAQFINTGTTPANSTGVYAETSGDFAGDFYRNGTTGARGVVRMWNDNPSSTGDVLELFQDGTGNTLEIFTGTDFATPKAVFDENGNLGIGVINPSNQLAVNGSNAVALVDITQQASGTALNIGFNGASGRVLNIDNNSSTAIGIDIDNGISTGRALEAISNHVSNVPVAYLQHNSTTATGPVLQLVQDGTGFLLELREDLTTRAVFDSQGHLGIGTTTPSGFLDLNGGVSSAYMANITNTNAGVSSGGLAVTSVGGISALRVTQNSSNSGNASFPIAEFLDGAIVRVEIQKDGNVGIGTSAPSEKLSVFGNIITVGSTGDLYLSASNGVFNAGGGIINNDVNIIADGSVTTFLANGDEDLYIEDVLEVGNQAYKPGGGAWAAISDARMKQDVNQYTDGLAAVLKIRPVTYRYNEESGLGTRETYVGVIAQELLEVAPYMVKEVAIGSRSIEDEDGNEIRIEHDGTFRYTVDPSALTYMTINAIQEQQAMIEALQAEVAALKAQLGK